MRMIKTQDGKRMFNPRYIRSVWIESDENGVMLRVVAEIQGGVVILREVNTYETIGAEAYITRQFEQIEEAMSHA